TGASIGDPDSPRPWPQWDKRKMILRSSGTNEDELLAIKRPVWMQITISAGRDVADPFGREIIDDDQAVVAPIGDEGDVLTVWRPLWLGLVSSQFGDLLCRLSTGYRRKPQMVFRTRPDSPLTVG